MKVFWGLIYFPLSSIYPQHAVRAVNVKTVTIITVGILFFPSFAFLWKSYAEKKVEKKKFLKTIRFVDRVNRDWCSLAQSMHSCNSLEWLRVGKVGVKKILTTRNSRIYFLSFLSWSEHVFTKNELRNLTKFKPITKQSCWFTYPYFFSKHLIG